MCEECIRVEIVAQTKSIGENISTQAKSIEEGISPQSKSMGVGVSAQSKSINAGVSAQSKTMPVRVDKGIPTFPAYKGETVFTPSDQEQIIETIDTVLLKNIIINPIPNNYGLITYNGSFITVS